MAKTIISFLIVLCVWTFIGYMAGFSLDTRGMNMGWFTFSGFAIAYFVAIFMPSLEG